MIAVLGLSAALDVTYLVDALRPGAIHRPHRVLALPGGKALNVVRAAHALGTTAQVVVPTGGFTGARVRDALAAEGVDLPALDAGGETRHCVTVFPDDGAAPTELYETAADVPDATWAAVRRRVDAIGEGWLAVSGSVPAARIAGLAETLADAARRGVRIALDTHGRALADLLSAVRPALVKVNRAEAEELLGPGGAHDLAVRLRARAEVAVVTDGPDGATAADGDDLWHAAAPPAGRFAVGSGDSFLAGLLVGLDAGTTLPEALRLATAAAAANTLAPGAALFSPEDARRIARTVAVSDPRSSS